MISFNPSIFINRLIVAHQGNSAYDQKFHRGVNIIRGDNAHGKSTIADFMFYVLGGDQTVWKEQALRCDSVTAELNINGADITIRRYISEDSRQSLQFFWGSLDEASKSPLTAWEIYPYSRSSSKESFSQKLFLALGLPEVRGAEGNNLTIHQLLRLIYVDQLSPYDALLRTESFDSFLKREAIGGLMLGLYDRSIHDDQLELQQKAKDLEAAKSEIKALRHVFSELNIEINPARIQNEHTQVVDSLHDVDKSILEITNALVGSVAFGPGEDGTANNLIRHKKYFDELLSKQSSLTFEIEDSKLFIKDLESKMGSLQDSISARRALGSISISHCPVCLAPLSEHSDPTTCCLCKAEVTPELVDARAVRMLSELEMQKRESSEILTSKELEAKRLARELKTVAVDVERSQRERDSKLELARSSRDSKLDMLFQERGRLTEKVKSLDQALKSIRILNDFESREKNIQSIIENLRYRISENKKKQAHRANTVNRTISDIALTILRADNVEDKFRSAENVELNWRDNTFSIDGRNNFSASSVVFARNAVHFAIFFASLKLDFMRYPRLIISDCIEDKGMIPARSGRFQKIVTRLSEAATVEHQIIFTTSMIDSSLDRPEYCIGPDYRDGVKTLSLGGENGEVQSSFA